MEETGAPDDTPGDRVGAVVLERLKTPERHAEDEPDDDQNTGRFRNGGSNGLPENSHDVISRNGTADGQREARKASLAW